LLEVETVANSGFEDDELEMISARDSVDESIRLQNFMGIGRFL
jgi:hypothetical protein